MMSSFCLSSNLGDDGSPAAVLASAEQGNSYSALSTAQLDPGQSEQYDTTQKCPWKI